MHAGQFLFFDAETFSAAKLETVGTWNYVTDRTTEIISIAFALDDEAPKIWLPGQSIPKAFTTAATLVAHNFMFERTLLTHILTPRHGWPEIPLERQICTMTMALANALPGALGSAAQALGLEYQKDREGYMVMRQLTQPRRARKGEDRNAIHRDTDPAKLKILYRYNKRDVETMRALFHQLPLLSDLENAVWQLDAVINARGFHIDTALATAARDVAKQEQAAINAAIAAVTDGAVLSVHQRDRIIAFVRQHGHALASLTKRSVSAVLAHETDDQVRQLLELRRVGARASTHKLNRLLKSVSSDDRLRGTLRFHGSSTGRWSGRGYQPQNLKKPETKDLDAAVGAILSGDIARVRALGPALTIAGDVSRAMISAAPGHVLISGDFSAIESRVLAWLTDEPWKLDNYCEYDATSRPELEPYCSTASRIFKRAVTPDDETERGVGKVCDLAFGFGGGLGAWRKFDNTDTYSDADVERFKSNWRREHPATTRFWRVLERTVHRAVFSGNIHALGDKITCRMDGEHLLLTLPSGRDLSYPFATLGTGKFEGTRELRFKDNAKGAWTDVSAWYGKLTENVVQAVARDLLAAAMLRVEATGYRIVLTVHDEIVAEVPEDFGSAEEFLALMVEAPAWARGLPVTAKVRVGKRYVKTKTPTPDSVASPVEAEPQCVQDEDDDFINSVPVEEHDASDENGDDENLELPPLEDLIGEPLINGFILCPFHEDTKPSLRIYPDHYHCFTCGTHGYTFDWLVHVQGMSEKEARQFIKDWDGPVIVQPSEDDTERRIRNALRLFDEAEPIANTMAERYLADWRRIDIAALPPDIDGALRFHPRCTFKSVRHPCLLALTRDPMTNAPCGIHRIALGSDGNRIERRMLGQAGAVKLWPAGSQLVVGEGIETVLAAATRIPYLDAPLRPAWSLLTAGRIETLPVIPGVERLIILVDNDANGRGQAAAARCDDRWTRAGCTVVQLTPQEPDSDFNDLIMEKA